VPRRRRIADLTGGAGVPPAPESIFGPEDDNVIPGEIIFALEADAAAEVAVSIAGIRGDGAGAVTEFGSAKVDKALNRLDVQSVNRIHGPSPAAVEGGVMMAGDLGLDGTFRVRYAAGEAPDAVAKRLNALAEVAWAEPNRWREASVVPNDPQFGSQWGLTRINCPDAWDQTTGNPSIVVAVLDTGVDLNHPDLAPLLVAGQDLVDFPPGSSPKSGWVFEGDFTGVDAVPQDEVGHGTHVSGTIACLSNNGVGVAGVTWNTRLMPVRVLARVREVATGQIKGSGSSANIAAGIRWAADNGARVINMSLGGEDDAMVEREAIAYAISRNVVVVAAMGNENSAVLFYPAAYPGVIAVGATDPVDHRAPFSNFGPHIDVAAPGVGIQSTYWDDTYASLSGTSMASPHVAGVAALILSANSALSAVQVGNLLRSTAKPLRDAPSDPVPNDRYGSGLVQAGAAVAAAAPVPVPSRAVCPSVVTTCPSRQVSCPTRSVTTCPSVNVVCASRQIICRTVQVTCQKSFAIVCASQAIICQVSASPACPPVSLADCPSLRCQRSLACGSIACGSIGCIPGGPGRGPAPGQLDDGWEQYDPHGYDPYGDEYE